MDPYKERCFKEAYSKETKLRLKWFKKNQQRLIEIAEADPKASGVTEKVLEEIRKNRQERYRQERKHARKIVEDAPLPSVDPRSIKNIMKPVDQKLIDLFYESNTQHRRLYLKKRYEILPEDRYYFPETTSFIYGWNMFDFAKTNGSSRFGRAKVIENSFYRRYGIHRDPEHYREPAKLSPIVCNCN